MNPVLSKARALGGDIRGPSEILCPGPGHSARDRSLSVHFIGGDFVCHSFADDDWRECREHVRRCLGLFPRAREVRHREAPAKRDTDDDARAGRASSIWNASRQLTPGGIAERYFRSRGLRLPYSAAMRWHPACPFGRDRVSCIVAAMDDPQTGEMTGIHRTALTPEGRKIDRKMLGRGGVVRLADDADVTTALGIAEGIETALSVIQSGWRPVWAGLSAGGIARLPVLAGIECLTIFADADDAGVDAAQKCAERWSAAGREARIVVAPEASTDWLDHLGEAGHAA